MTARVSKRRSDYASQDPDCRWWVIDPVVLDQALSQKGYEVFSAKMAGRPLKPLRGRPSIHHHRRHDAGTGRMEGIGSSSPGLASPRVIIMTTHEKEVKNMAHERGAWAYVEKPYLSKRLKNCWSCPNRTAFPLRFKRFIGICFHSINDCPPSPVCYS